jgi:hypothetical protein
LQTVVETVEKAETGVEEENVAALVALVVLEVVEVCAQGGRWTVFWPLQSTPLDSGGDTVLAGTHS